MSVPMPKIAPSDRHLGALHLDLGIESRTKLVEDNLVGASCEVKV